MPDLLKYRLHARGLNITAHSMDLLKFPNIIAALLFSICALFCVVFVIYDCCRGSLSAPCNNRGLNKRALNSLPRLAFSAASASENKLEDCAICLAGFEEGEEIRVLPHCGHGYHVICIDAWLASHSTCPSCRRILVMSPTTECWECGRSSGGAA